MDNSMNDAVQTTSGFLFSRGAAAFTGLLGGLSVSFFHQPEKLHKHGKLAAGAIIGGVSAAGAFSMVGLAARAAGLDLRDLDVAFGLGFPIGLSIIGVVVAVAVYLEKNEKKDIVELAQGVREAIATVAATPKPRKPRKPAAKKTVKRKAVAK